MREFLCVVLLLSATSAIAEPVKGAGVTSCGKWVEARKKDTYFPQLNWVLGFISSYDHFVYIGKDKNGVFGEEDFKSIAVWMDNYCQRKPSETVYAGTLELIEELRNRAG